MSDYHYCQCPACDVKSEADAEFAPLECVKGSCAECLTDLGWDAQWGIRCEHCVKREWTSKSETRILTDAIDQYLDVLIDRRGYSNGYDEFLARTLEYNRLHSIRKRLLDGYLALVEREDAPF